MIRINLLGVARPTAKAAGPAPTAARQGLIFGGSALIAFMIVGFFFWYWTHQINALNEEYAKQKREADRLAQIRAENQRYQAQLDQLQRRNNTIQQLLQNKVGPADFMASLADLTTRRPDVYLLTVAPEGNRVAIRGQANTVESISRYIGALKESNRFQDVQLRQYFQDDEYNQLSFKFNLDCIYKLPPPAAPGAPPPAGAGAPARRAAM